ncbi:bifunctional diguanylate cyclase/phosphodiesterase [Erwinia oleae]|uniref:bifunctional diguanylate cyclase/phosphodiesterase n=1 Tax=Erwinia oleae TaxID=796334 RepID=UPI000689C0A9|nr:EAL domain-containing protein [Erwinia oleae]
MNYPPLPEHHIVTDDHKAAFFTRRLLMSLILLLSGVILLAMLLVVGIAWRQNEDATQQQRFLLSNMWKDKRQSILTDIRDYAFWSEAWNHLHLQVDTVWAFDQQNFGPGLFQEYHYEGVFVVDGQGRTRYSVINGKLDTLPLESWLGIHAAPLIRKARSLATTEAATTQNVIIGTTPALVAAAAITPGKVPGLGTLPGPPSVMVFVSRFTPEKLKRLGNAVGVKNVRVPTTAQDAFVTPFMVEEVAEDAPIIIRWDPRQPGRNLLICLLPALFFAAFALGLVARRVINHAMSSAVLSDRRFAQLKHSQRELAASEARFRDVAETASDWIWETNPQGMITYLSRRFTSVTGFEISRMLGRSIDDILLHETEAVSLWIFQQRADGQRRQLRCYSFSAQNEKRICSLVANPVLLKGQIAGYRGTVSDITQEVEAEARLHYLSQHDTLTGLPNRVYMLEFLRGKLHAQPTAERPLVLISLDLDRFKPVNDAFGYAAGDSVLVEASHRLRGALNAGDLVSRTGGDEFMLLVCDLTNEEEIDHCCVRLQSELCRPFYIGQQELFIGVSMGIALAPVDAMQADELLRLADIALYKSKREGRNCWTWYRPDMAEQLIHRRELERNLRMAIVNDELKLYYQPRYCLQKSRMEGAEALIRWAHPPTGLIMPDSFIPLAEETGLIIEVSNWVLLRACTDALAWPNMMYVSVNISPVEFRSGNLVKRVADALHKSGLAASRLELEITENITLENPQNALTMMQALKKLGVRLTVDDFGAGYASLNYLKTFPFDGMKMDRSYLHDFPQSRQAVSIVEGIIALGRAFSLTVTAEGIETQAQWEELKAISCQEGQGYYLGRPMPLERFLPLLDTPLLLESHNVEH